MRVFFPPPPLPPPLPPPHLHHQHVAFVNNDLEREREDLLDKGILVLPSSSVSSFVPRKVWLRHDVIAVIVVLCILLATLERVLMRLSSIFNDLSRLYGEISQRSLLPTPVDHCPSQTKKKTTTTKQTQCWNFVLALCILRKRKGERFVALGDVTWQDKNMI